MAIYSDSVIVKTPLLIISGQTPQKDEVTPKSIDEQLDIVLDKIAKIISDNHAEIKNISKMNVYLTSATFLPIFRAKMTDFLNDLKPAMTLVIVAGLVNPEFKVEIDALVALPL